MSISEVTRQRNTILKYRLEYLAQKQLENEISISELD